MYIRAGDYVYTCGKVVRQECWGECWGGDIAVLHCKCFYGEGGMVG